MLRGDAIRTPPAGERVDTLSPDGRLVALGSRYEQQVRDLETGQNVLMIRADTTPGSTDSIRSVTFAPDSRRIAVLFGNRDVRIYATPVDAPDAWSGRELQRLSVPGRRFPVAITELAFSPDGTRLVTGGAGGSVYLWSLGGD